MKEENEERDLYEKMLQLYFFYIFYYLFSDVLDDGNSFLIIEEKLRGLTRTRNIFPGFCTGLPGSSPAVSPTTTMIRHEKFRFRLQHQDI